jgi:hypothetical protein
MTFGVIDRGGNRYERNPFSAATHGGGEVID